MPARRTLTITAVAAALVIGLSAQAFSSAQVTKGDFEPLDIPDHPVDGHATMIRTGDGRTKISVEVSGLEPGLAYPSHVHNQPCDIGRGGGHYQDVPGGGTVPPNELWPSSDPKDPMAGLIANPAGNASGHGTAPWVARPEAQSVVIHQSGNPAVRIACADLA